MMTVFTNIEVYTNYEVCKCDLPNGKTVYKVTERWEARYENGCWYLPMAELFDTLEEAIERAKRQRREG